jgi:hypothetical protein
MVPRRSLWGSPRRKVQSWGRLSRFSWGVAKGGFVRTKLPLLRFNFLCHCCGQITLKGLSVLPFKSYQKIISKTTREVLRPAGLSQKGTSRFWYLDCGWYACFAEFQPFSGRQGRTLNFGLSWLWYPKEHWTFDVSNRVEGFSSTTRMRAFALLS